MIGIERNKILPVEQYWVFFFFLISRFPVWKARFQGVFFWSIGFLCRKRTIHCYSHPHRNGLLLEVNLIVSDSKRNHLDLIMQLVTFYWDTGIFPVVWEEKKIVSLWSFAGSVLCQWMQGYMQTVSRWGIVFSPSSFRCGSTSPSAS